MHEGARQDGLGSKDGALRPTQDGIHLVSRREAVAGSVCTANRVPKGPGMFSLSEFRQVLFGTY